MKEIEFIIDADGNVQIDVKDGGGPNCIDLTKELEENLGIIESREKKPEFYKLIQSKTKRYQLYE